MTEKLEITWNQAPEHYSHYHLGTCLEGLRKTTENLSQGTSYPSRNSNPVPAGTGYRHTNLNDTLILYKRNLLSEKTHKYHSWDLCPPNRKTLEERVVRRTSLTYPKRTIVQIDFLASIRMLNCE